MAKGSENAVMTTVNTAVTLPSFIKTGVAAGTERLGGDDLKMPFLRLSQDKTPQVVDKKFASGLFFNSVTEQTYGKELIVLVILVGRGRAMFEDYNKGGAMLCVSHNGIKALAPNGQDDQGRPTDNCTTCTLAKWTGESPDCSEQGNYLVLIPGEAFPAKLVLQRSSFATHRKLATALYLAANASKVPVYAFKVRLFAAENKRKVMIIDAEISGPLKADEGALYEQAEKTFDKFQESFFHSVPAGTETLAAEE